MKFLLVAFLLITAHPVGAQSPYDWFSAGRSLSPGEVLTVGIEESVWVQDRGEREGATSRNQGGSLSAAVDGLEAAPDQLPSAGFGSEYGRQQSERSRHTRNDRFSAQLSVEVVELLEDGRARVRGQRTVVVDRTERTLRVSGVVDPRDVSSNRVIASTRLADADISYDGTEGVIGGNIFTRILGWLWP